MPALGWVLVRKEAESLSQSVCFLPFHPKRRPKGSLDGAVSIFWSTWIIALGGLQNLGGYLAE